MSQTVTLHDVDIPTGYEPTGKYGEVPEGEFGLGNGCLIPGPSLVPYLVLRRVKQYREPVLPGDGGKQCEFSHDNDHWIVGKLIGWTDDEHPWEGQSSYYRYCRIEDNA